MSSAPLLVVGRVVLPDHVLERGAVLVRDGRIMAVDRRSSLEQHATAGPTPTFIDAGDGYILPGFVDIHVHGGLGADFMDGTAAAYETALRRAPPTRHDEPDADDDSRAARPDHGGAEIDERVHAEGGRRKGEGGKDNGSDSPARLLSPSPLIPPPFCLACSAPTSTVPTSVTKPAGRIRAKRFGRRSSGSMPSIRLRRCPGHGDDRARATGAEEFAAACRERGVPLKLGPLLVFVRADARGRRLGRTARRSFVLRDERQIADAASFSRTDARRTLEATLYFDE